MRNYQVAWIVVNGHDLIPTIELCLPVESKDRILEKTKPGIYRGLDGNEMGKKCVNAVLDDLKTYMSNFQPTKIIEEAYGILEETLFAEFTPMGKNHLIKTYNIKIPDAIELEKGITVLSENSRFMASAR